MIKEEILKRYDLTKEKTIKLVLLNLDNLYNEKSATTHPVAEFSKGLKELAVDWKVLYLLSESSEDNYLKLSQVLVELAQTENGPYFGTISLTVSKNPKTKLEALEKLLNIPKNSLSL